MDEFSLINRFFKSIPHQRKDVVFGIGDDAACLEIPDGMQLLVSCDTLVENVHFLGEWDAYDIACKAVMVNVSDIAAMGGTPCWLTLALTLPELNQQWLQRFSQGLHDSLSHYNIALIGGDTTRGPLSMTLTIHGMAPKGTALRRSAAVPGDKIYVSGELGGAALAVANLTRQDIDEHDRARLMQKLLHPVPRIDLGPYLRTYANAAIDISDGLSADLNHICEESQVGACLFLQNIPVHPLIKKYHGDNALDFALSGGDDYELCFTVAPQHEEQLLMSIKQQGLSCYPIGMIEKQLGLRAKRIDGDIVPLEVLGYRHFS